MLIGREQMSDEQHDHETRMLVGDLRENGLEASVYRECGGQWEGDGARVELARGAFLVASWSPDADENDNVLLTVRLFDVAGDELPAPEHCEHGMRHWEFRAWLPVFMAGWEALVSE